MDSFTNRMDYLVQKNNKNHVFLKHRSMAFKRSAVGSLENTDPVLFRN